MAKTLYSLRKAPSNLTSDYIITKLDGDYNVEAVYNLSKTECDCPHGARLRGTKITCKHVKLIERFIAAGHVGDGYMLDGDTRMWVDPILGEDQLDGLILGNRPHVIGQSDEDKLVDVVAPALSTEGTFVPPSIPKAGDGNAPAPEFKFNRRRL